MQKKALWFKGRMIDKHLILLFLTPKHSKGILFEALEKYCIDKNNYLIENPKYEDVPKYLSIAEFGVYVLNYPSIRVGTKFVEYCAIGQPVITNEHVKGAKCLIERYKLGIILENNLIEGKQQTQNPKEINRWENYLSRREEYVERCRIFAKERFPNEKIAQKYADIYNELLHEDEYRNG